MPKPPPIPFARDETIRRTIVDVLEKQRLSAGEISKTVRIPEKDVYEHLYHIKKTMIKRDEVLVITPAQCRKCSFVFKKREKLKKPGKCPVCKGESIQEPLFSIQ